MARKRHPEVTSDLPIDSRTVLGAAQMGVGFMKKGGNVASASLELLTTNLDIEDAIQQGATIMSEDGEFMSVPQLEAESKAFKNYARGLSKEYGDRLLGLGANVAGASAAAAAVSLMFGPPGIIVGLGASLVGGMGGGMVKDFFFPNQQKQFLQLASELQGRGRMAAEAFKQGAQLGPDQGVSPEHAFVALVTNLPDEKEIARITKSLGKHGQKGLVAALKTNAGREALRKAMVDYDDVVRSTTGAVSGIKGFTLSEEFAQLINTGQMAGVDLLNNKRTLDIATKINVARTEQLENYYAALEGQKPQVASNPNQHLPNHTSKHLAV